MYVHCVETITAMRFLLRKKKYPMMFDSHMLAMASGNRFAKIYEFVYRKTFAKIINHNKYWVIRTQDDDYVNSHMGVSEELTPFISFGTDTLLFQPSNEVRAQFRKENNIPEDSLVVVYTGKLTPAKGGKMLAETFNKKFECNKDITLVIVGTPQDDEYGREVLKLLSTSENRVCMFPTQPYLDLAKFYQAADLSVFPRQCSMSFYDAQACGLPVLSEDNNVNVDRCSHDIQLHLHPNWLHSIFDQGKWKISATGYKLHDFGLEQNENGALIIEEGKRYLEETIREVDKDYRCVAYRAGGFCIQPEKTLLLRLRENGILIDSSVAQYQRAKDSIQDYDFRDMPEQLSWWMQPETGVKRDISRQPGALLEISIGGVRNSLSKYQGIPFNELKIKSRTGVGSGIRIPQAKISPIRLKLRNLKRHLWSYGILSLDTRGYKVLMRDIDELYHKYHCEQKDQYVCLICHPKLASDAVIDNMRRFVQQVQMHPDMYEFVTMQEIASVYQL